MVIFDLIIWEILIKYINKIYLNFKQILNIYRLKKRSVKQ